MAAARKARAKAAPAPPDDATLRRDRELRDLVGANPTDAGAILVYADWLEEIADLPRARFLRLQQQLRGLAVSHPKLLKRGRELHDLGITLPADWVAAVTYPRLDGTAWDGKDDDGALTWRFLPAGVLNYTQPSGTFENGTWRQVGITVAMETNAHYADYFGVIIGDTIRGNAHNIVSHKWRWKVMRTEDAQVASVPDSVNRTVHDDHLTAPIRSPRRDSGKPAPKPKKPARLARAAPLARKTPLRAKKRAPAPKRRPAKATRARSKRGR